MPYATHNLFWNVLASNIIVLFVCVFSFFGYGLVKNRIELYFQIFNTQNYILFKISASVLFVKYS